MEGWMNRTPWCGGLDLVKNSVEVAEEGRVAAVVEAEAAGEGWVGGEAAPALADEGCAREGGRERREAEEDLGE